MLLFAQKKKTLRLNTKHETSPLDAPDTIHTNRFQIYEGTKWNTEKSIEDKEKS